MNFLWVYFIFLINHLIFSFLSFFLQGNPESVMNELIREAADFYMNVYPQLTHGVEYKKIGIALITEYPCLACEDTINPHVCFS